MQTIQQINRIEEQHHKRGPSGNPLLGKAHKLLVKRWESGTKDRETALRLLFLNWFALVEPLFLTGLNGGKIEHKQNKELFDYLGGESSYDPELLFVISVMCEVGAWALGDERFWSALGKKFRTRLSSVGKTSLSNETFKNRGEYGYYFAHQLKSQ